MERKKFFAQRTGNVSRPETFAIRVEDYDTSGAKSTEHRVRGERLDTGEMVEVTLRKVDYNQTGRFKRSEIADFAAPRKDRQHPGTAAGGTLLVQEAFKQQDGSFAARWMQSLSHTEGEAEVFMATIHVGPVKYGTTKTEEFPQGRPYSLMTVLHDGDFRHLSQDMADVLKLTPPFKVDSVDELREAVSDLLNDGLGVGVRVSNPDGFDAMYVGRKKDVSVEEAVNTFLKDVEPIAEAINAGEAVCEVVPYGNVWAGPATVDIMQKNSVVSSRLRQFNGENTDDKGRTHPVNVYRPAIVAARLTKPDEAGRRTVFFSHFEPVWTRQPVHGLVSALCYAKTEHLAPEPPKLNAPAAGGNDAPAAGDTGPDSEQGSFDGGMDEDLMAAAAGAAGGDDIGDDIPPAAEAQPEPSRPAPRARYAGRARA
jgi:hypothetical protein